MKQKFEIEVEVGERIPAHKLGLMIDSLEGIGGCYAKEVFMGLCSNAEYRPQSMLEYVNVEKQADQVISIKQYDIKKVIPGPYGSGHQPFKELYPKIRTELNKIRRELIIQALEEVLPGLFNVTRYEQDPVVHSRYVAVILNAKGIKIKHYVTDASPAMPSDICCIYQDETPIHFFNYL